MAFSERGIASRVETMLAQNVAVEIEIPQSTVGEVLGFIDNTDPEYSADSYGNDYRYTWSSVSILGRMLTDNLVDVYRNGGDINTNVKTSILPSHIEAMDRVVEMSAIPNADELIAGLKNEYDYSLTKSFPDKDPYFSHKKIVWFAIDQDSAISIEEAFIEYSKLFDDINPNEKENNLLKSLGKMVSRIAPAKDNQAIMLSIRQKDMEEVTRELLEQLYENRKPDFARSFKQINTSFEDSGGKRTKAYQEFLEKPHGSIFQ